MNFKQIFLILALLTLVGCQSNTPEPQNVNLSQSQPILPDANKTQQEVPKSVIAQPKDNEATTSPEMATSTISTTTPPEIKDTTPEPSELPVSFNLPVLWGGQAPYANWDKLHQEACEEASMLMASKYFKKETVSPHIMEQGILNLIKWETDNGYQVDVTAGETVEILKKYFSLSALISKDVSANKIKTELNKGKLVLIPAAGRLLGNPNFTGEGPIYHMLVVRGWDDQSGEFITNDPGTRKGDSYRYKYNVLINAIHDWNHELAEGGMTNQEIAQGQKVIIIVSK